MLEHGDKTASTIWGFFLLGMLSLILFAGDFYSPGFHLSSLFSSLFLSVLIVVLLVISGKISIKLVRRIFFILILFVVVVLVSSSIFFIGYYFTHDYQIADDHSVLAIFQSDIGEIISYTFKNANVVQIILLALVVFLPFFFIYKFSKTLAMVNYADRHDGSSMFSSGRWVLAGLVFLVLAFVLPSKVLASSSFFYSQFTTYKNELSKFRKFQSQFSSAERPDINASKSEKGETYIVVVGESLNKHHMGLYGYHRETTPHMDNLHRNGELIKFDNVIANHTHTKQALSYALTNCNQYNGKTFVTSESVINILNSVDIETYWISNQVRYGVWDNAVGIVADQADHKVYFNKYVGRSFENKNYDEVVLPEVKKALDVNTEKNKVIFVHLIGNHWDYSERYHPDFKMFDGEVDKGEMGRGPNNISNVNHYDNSVLYNDHLINQIIDMLKSTESKVKGLLYMSDHSEEVWGGKAHHSSKFTFSMIETPMVMWLSDEYKNRYADKFSRLGTNKAKHWSNDLFHDLILGMIGIEIDNQNQEHNLAASAFSLPVYKIRTLHGKRSYNDSQNEFHAIQRNIDSLRKYDAMERVIPHRVNSIGKLKAIQNSGFNAFEIDALVKVEGGLAKMEIGHDISAMSSKFLEDFLEFYDFDQKGKIWLDAKNLSANNLDPFIAALTEIENTHALKNHFLIESKMVSEDFKKLSAAGYHTSYYLPTPISKITNQDLLEKRAKSISEQIRKQKVSAVSFDHRLYPFVKKHLEKKIGNDVEYHLWDLSLSLKDMGFFDALVSKTYYQDNRVKTILARYPSKYDL